MQFITLARTMYKFRKIITLLTIAETSFRAYKKVEKARSERSKKAS